MDKQFLVFLLIAHVLGDYHFQPQQMAEEKNRQVRALFLHGVVVFAVTMPIFVLYKESDVLISLGFVAASHLLIDFAKSRMLEAWPSLAKRESIVFWVDQAVHILIILAVVLEAPSLTLRMAEQELVYDASKALLAFLLLTKPANVMIALSTKRYHYETEGEGQVLITDLVPDVAINTKGREGAGALIGSLERLLSAILLWNGQLAAIGLIFTAKSIARFDRIQKDQRFAEYYLIGSLSSLLICFLVMGFLRYLI